MISNVIITILVNCVVLLVLLLLNKKELSRLHRLIELLDNGGWRSCPLYQQLVEAKKSEKVNEIMKGGEKYGSME